MAWKDLSLREKAAYIHTGVRNGLTTIEDIGKAYNKFDNGGDLNPYSAGKITDALWEGAKEVIEPKEEPVNHYLNTISEEEAEKLGYYRDARGHRDDRVKLPSHPSHPSRGSWKNINEFSLSDKGIADPNYTLFGLADGGQDPQAILTYNGGIVIPEVTVTPNGNYYHNTYDDIKLRYDNGGTIRHIKIGSEEYNDNIRKQKELQAAGYKIKADGNWGSWQNDLYSNLYKSSPKKVNKTYSVAAGDSMWKIAHDNNMDLEQLNRLNPQIKNNLIHPGDVLSVGSTTLATAHDIRKEWEKEKRLNTDNLAAIQSVKHDDNYIVIDKKNSKLSVYSPDNKLLYQTDKIATGKSGNDYNTITYVNEQGKIISGKGNESTPAGITQITGTGTYHGYKSFSRGRKSTDNKGNIVYEDVASSLHLGHITDEKKASNGCVRIGGKEITELSNFVGMGTNIYTLPEKAGSRFVVKDGKINFVADNTYGISLHKIPTTLKDYKESIAEKKAKNPNYISSYEKKYGNNWEKHYEEDYKSMKKESDADLAKYIKKYGKSEGTRKYKEDYPKRFWDDYNTYNDKSYSPLHIVAKRKTDNAEYNKNQDNYMKAIMDSKESIQKKFNIDSDTYNHLAELALGIAEQETKYGTSRRKQLKDTIKSTIGEEGIDALQFGRGIVKSIKNVKNPLNFINVAGKVIDGIERGKRDANLANSEGITQIKYRDDIKNKELREIYKDLGITESSLNNASGAALGTLARLAYIFNTEIRGREFIGKNNKIINPFDALLYKYQGHNSWLKNHTASPEENEYISNIKNYANNYDMYSIH